MKTSKNEEILSRRGFFKKAAKGALPILGAIVLAGVPFSKTEAYCGCSGTCSGACSGSCNTTCYNECYTHCKYTCKGTCKSVSKY